jgi:hypothetical protein
MRSAPAGRPAGPVKAWSRGPAPLTERLLPEPDQSRSRAGAAQGRRSERGDPEVRPGRQLRAERLIGAGLTAYRMAAIEDARGPCCQGGRVALATRTRCVTRVPAAGRRARAVKQGLRFRYARSAAPPCAGRSSVVVKIALVRSQGSRPDEPRPVRLKDPFWPNGTPACPQPGSTLKKSGRPEYPAAAGQRAVTRSRAQELLT